jgi:hypothetical protein
MNLPRSVAEVLEQHVTLEVESIVGMYLNVYQPRLQTDLGLAAFFGFHRGHTFASSALMNRISRDFIAAVERFAKKEGIPSSPLRNGSARMMWSRSIAPAGPRGSLWWARRRRRRRSSAPKSAAIPKQAGLTPGSCRAQPW